MFAEIGRFTGKNINQGDFGYWFSQIFENTFISFLGAQSYTISVKLADKMHCFFCDNLSALRGSLKTYDVPVCPKCANNNPLASYYKHDTKIKFTENFLIDPPILKPEHRQCSLCKEDYITNILFEDFGFNIDVCPKCMLISNVNIDLSINHLKPRWRHRSVN